MHSDHKAIMLNFELNMNKGGKLKKQLSQYSNLQRKV